VGIPGSDREFGIRDKPGTISHSLGHSTEKCNLSTMGNMVATVSQLMEDGGDTNRDGHGHRGWCLNPPMGKVGFGSGGKSFSAMWCMDGSGKSRKGIWAYPGTGLFPLEYVHGNAWSFYGIDATNPKVEMFRLAKRPEQPFAAAADIPGHMIKVPHVSRAMMNGINFEPAEPAKRGIYWVRVLARACTKATSSNSINHPALQCPSSHASHYKAACPACLPATERGPAAGFPNPGSLDRNHGLLGFYGF